MPRDALLAPIVNFGLAVKTLVLTPNQCFREMSDEGGWLEPFLFFCTCAGVNALCMSTMLFFAFRQALSADSQAAQTFGQLNVALLFFVVFQVLLLSMIMGGFALSFMSTIVLHFLGGKGSFESTYRVLCCSWVILLVAWIPFAGPLLALYFFVLAWFGLKETHAVSGGKAILSIFIAAFALAFTGFLLGIGVTAAGWHSQSESDVWKNAPAELLDRYRSKAAPTPDQ